MIIFLFDNILMSNKTISINPSLFNVGRSRTKKYRKKSVKPQTIPIISPNVLKNKFLKRIKEHKQRETQDLENNKRKLPAVNVEPKPVQNVEFSDEFNDSLNYLQELTKSKQAEKEKLERQRRKEELERRTVRNYHVIPETNPNVNIDLPDDLQITPSYERPVYNNYGQQDVPYGILKGGTKPSYREWAKTHRNNIVTNPNASLLIEGGHTNKVKTERENRLESLRQKIKNKTEEKMMNEVLIKKPDVVIQNNNSSVIVPNEQKVVVPSDQKVVVPSDQKVVVPSDQKVVVPSDQKVVVPSDQKVIAVKQITKKTIKKKYTLGRSRIKRTVGVLIKDRSTRKRVLTAQKDLKRKPINDIKVYLREHNLIKTGSNAPNDVLRKIYESAMLAGEITNSNPDTLLHNLSKEEKEL